MQRRNENYCWSCDRFRQKSERCCGTDPIFAIGIFITWFTNLHGPINSEVHPQWTKQYVRHRVVWLV